MKDIKEKLIRDICSVDWLRKHPKSLARRRVEELLQSKQIHPFTIKLIAGFVEDRLDSQKQEMVEKLEGVKLKIGDTSVTCDNESCTAAYAYNQGLKKAIEIIKNK